MMGRLSCILTNARKSFSETAGSLALVIMNENPDVLVTLPMFHVPLDEFADRFNLHTLWQTDRPEELLQRLGPGCRAAAVRDNFTADMMDQLPGLGLIAVCGVGYDEVDVAAAIQRGIKVTNTPDVLTEDVADLAVGLMLAAGRRIVKGDRYVRSGRWVTDGQMSYTGRVQGQRVGIIGMGRIGCAIARRCEAFNMEIAYHNRNPRTDVPQAYKGSPKELAAWADYLVVVLPGGPETHHLVDSDVLEALGPEGILVNVGRGSNLDQVALIRALEQGTIGAAALDVLDGEPEVPAGLLAIKDNLILQPHQASATFETRRAMVELTFANVKAFFEGSALLSPIPEHGG